METAALGHLGSSGTGWGIHEHLGSRSLKVMRYACHCRQHTPGLRNLGRRAGLGHWRPAWEERG